MMLYGGMIRIEKEIENRTFYTCMPLTLPLYTVLPLYISLALLSILTVLRSSMMISVCII